MTSTAAAVGTLLGPGVDDTQITLGTLVDPVTDRGFLAGLQLWKKSVNDAGGICGRTVTVDSSGSGEGLTDAYRGLGTQVLGFVTQTESPDTSTALATLLSADQVPALTVSGTAADLLYTSPVVIGPTDDILAINAIDELVSSGALKAGDEIGFVTDGSAAAANALEGLTWYAPLHGLTVVTSSDLAVLATFPAVLAISTPQMTAEVVRAVPSTTVVVTDLAGYDPTLIDATDAAHLDVTLSTPAVGSDHPGATAVAAAMTAEGVVPGALSFAGYAAGATWQRLLTAACDAQSLTRAGVLAALTTVGQASVESLLGGTDPGLPVAQQQPATRASALAAADPSQPTGLKPLTSLIVADGIDAYSAGTG